MFLFPASENKSAAAPDPWGVHFSGAAGLNGVPLEPPKAAAQNGSNAIASLANAAKEEAAAPVDGAASGFAALGGPARNTWVYSTLREHSPAHALGSAASTTSTGSAGSAGGKGLSRTDPFDVAWAARQSSRFRQSNPFAAGSTAARAAPASTPTTASASHQNSLQSTQTSATGTNAELPAFRLQL